MRLERLVHLFQVIFMHFFNQCCISVSGKLVKSTGSDEINGINSFILQQEVPISFHINKQNLLQSSITFIVANLISSLFCSQTWLMCLGSYCPNNITLIRFATAAQQLIITISALVSDILFVFFFQSKPIWRNLLHHLDWFHLNSQQDDCLWVHCKFVLCKCVVFGIFEPYVKRQKSSSKPEVREMVNWQLANHTWREPKSRWLSAENGFFFFLLVCAHSETLTVIFSSDIHRCHPSVTVFRWGNDWNVMWTDTWFWLWEFIHCLAKLASWFFVFKYNHKFLFLLFWTLCLISVGNWHGRRVRAFKKCSLESL